MMHATYPFMRKWDVLILCIAFVACLTVWLIPKTYHGRYAVIMVENRVCATVSLESDKERFTVKGAEDFVFSVIDGKIAVVAAPCQNQICVHTRGIHKAGQQIVCLPNRLQIMILSDETAPDAVI